jgi:hypothetical protein
MKRICLIIFIIPFMVSCCKKENGPSNSGTVTINNELSGSGPYYAKGFSVKTGEVITFINPPNDVISIQEDDLNMVVRQLFFSCENYNNSFSIYGDYADATTAKTTFDNLRTFTDTTWTASGDSVVPNQIWLFRTSDLKYAKIRVISIFSEIRAGMPFPYAECSFEWTYQPDGTKIFP